MTRVALLTPSITTGDAVSNDILGMHAALSRRGYDAQIFADASSLSGHQIRPSNKLNHFLNNSEALLIYHYSTGWDEGLAILRSCRCNKVVKYHNVTPPEFFTRFSEAHVLMAHGGRKQLIEIARAGCDLYLSDSRYNMSELVASGANEKINAVVPPFHHVDRLNSVQPDPKVLETYGDGKTNVLMVGRLVPNKSHAELIEAFANYYYHYNNNSRLLIVGKHDGAFRGYYNYLLEMARRLKLERAVVFTQAVTDSALKAYYLTAHVFLITSKHEGFCVPLVEAMAMKIPIVAYSSSAIPDTAGDGALIWPERDPRLAAESIHAIISDDKVGKSLGQMGWQRYQQLFTNAQIEQQLMAAVGPLLTAASPVKSR